MYSTVAILKAIGDQPNRSYSSFMGRLMEAPAHSEHSIFLDMLNSLKALRDLGVIEICEGDKEIRWLGLTPIGLERLKEAQEFDRQDKIRREQALARSPRQRAIEARSNVRRA